MSSVALRGFTRLGTLIALTLAMSLVISACGGGSAPPADKPSAAGGAAPAGSGSQPAPYPTEKLLIGLPAPNAVYWDIYVAKEKGFFKDEGLDPEYVITNSSSASVQQLAAKAIHLSASTPDVLISAAEKGGSNLKILFTAMNKLPWSLVVRGDIKDYADLKGKTIGVSALKGGETSLTRRLLAKHGLKEGDYDLRVVGATPAKYAAMKNGSIVASVLYQPTDFTAVAEGYKRLAFFTELDQQFPFPVYGVDTAWASQSERGVRIARALIKAHRWLYDPKNAAEAVKILQDTAKVAPDVGEATYKLFFQELKAYSQQGEVDLKGLQTAIDIMVEDGDLSKPAPSPEKFVDTTMLAKAQGSR